MIIQLSRQEDNIKSDLRQIFCEGVDWIQVTEGRVQFRGLVKKVYSNSIKGADHLDQLRACQNYRSVDLYTLVCRVFLG
jgi:hypothetical protein